MVASSRGGGEDNSPSNTGDKAKAYTIDIRVFLAMIVSSMAMAFGAGVAFGPSPTDVFSMDAAATLEQRQVDLREQHVNFEQPSLEDLGDGNVVMHPESKSGEASSSSQQEHLPAGQHLLVDIKNVEAAFLNSEERLADAMVDVVKSAGLTLLSYHCHSLLPAGVSCVGVLLESHISFHTWPEEGVITLDLFTCGSNPLLPVVKDLERLFGIPRVKPNSTELEKVVTLWSHELRGFRDSPSKHPLDGQSDLATWVVSPMEVLKKEEIVSVESPFQRIDIWDVIEIDDTPSYLDAIKHNLQEGDPRWKTAEIVTPERFLFLDGRMQSMSDTEREFHEALVHPAMFAHSNPENIAIVGGGEGAVLREVLKHKTVKSATMIEIDRMMVDIARQHLPKMNDCSDLVGAADVCFDDERTNIVYQDGRTWFVDNHGKLDQKFDVIIMDALDPEDDKNHISDGLYTNENFLDALLDSLSDDGVISIQVGAAPNIHDPREDKGVHHVRAKLFNMLENHKDVATMFVYEESHCGFIEPRAFLAVCKNYDCRKHWYATNDVIDYQIYERIVDTVSGEPTLIHFDGASQHFYTIPPKAWETIYCRREPTPFECDYIHLDPTKGIFELGRDDEETNFTIEKVIDQNGETIARITAKQNIPKGSYIMPGDLAASFIVTDESQNNLKENTQIADTGKVAVIEDFLDFVAEHGHRSSAGASGLTYVEIGLSILIRRTNNESEVNVGRWVPKHPSGKIPVYSPVYERHMLSFDLFMVATRDIQAGEELVRLDNMWDV